LILEIGHNFKEVPLTAYVIGGIFSADATGSLEIAFTRVGFVYLFHLTRL
jgi:hypothetical protein